MKHLFVLTTFLFIVQGCSAQSSVQGLRVNELFKHNVYDKTCKIYTPDYFVNGKFFSFRQGNMYSFDFDDFCAVKENQKILSLPNRPMLKREEFDYRILNDSVAVFFFNNFYELLYYANFKTGELVKVDTIVKNISFEKTIGKKNYTLKKFSFVGGVFCSNKLYYLSARENSSDRSLLLKFNISGGALDTLQTNFIFENYLANPKSSDKYIIFQNGGHVRVINKVANNNHAAVFNFDNNYLPLDFINDEILMLHHLREPAKFGLLNVNNGKIHLFELEKRIFTLANIRQEEILKKNVDGPNDGLNQLNFKYLSCRGNKNELLLSFADRQDNRILYSIAFNETLLEKLN